MSTRSIRRAAVAASALAVALAACSDDGEPPPDATGEPTAEASTPELTAPATQSPEDEASEQIRSTLRDLVAGLDDYLADPRAYISDDDAWSSDVVDQWPVRDDARSQLETFVVSWANSEVEQVGETVVADHTVDSVELDENDEPLEATSTACLDMTEIETVDYAGDPADTATQPHQTWEMTWYYLPPDPGWTAVEIAMSDGSC